MIGLQDTSTPLFLQASSGFSKFCKNSNTRGPTAKFRLIVGGAIERSDRSILHIQIRKQNF